MSRGGGNLIIPTEKMPIYTSQLLQSIFSPGSKRTTILVNEDGVVQINQYLVWPFDRSVEWKEATQYLIWPFDRSVEWKEATDFLILFVCFVSIILVCLFCFLFVFVLIFLCSFFQIVSKKNIDTTNLQQLWVFG